MTAAPQIEIRRISETYARLYLGEEPIMFLYYIRQSERWHAFGPLDISEIGCFSTPEEAHDFAAAQLARHPQSLLIREALKRLHEVGEALCGSAELTLSLMSGTGDPAKIWAEALDAIEDARDEMNSVEASVPLPPEGEADRHADQS